MVRSTILPHDRVTIAGVINVTPDSFSDGGRFVQGGVVDVEAAGNAAAALVAEGADWIDVGGESTRPGSVPVSAAEEMARTAPVIEAITKRVGVRVSIDTRCAIVAEAALDAGASIVNDVSGLEDGALASLVAARGAGLVIGHLRGTPATMQDDVCFEDVLTEVGDELAASVRRALDAGIAAERIAVDPGIGFGKRLEHNLALLANVGVLRARLGLPVMVGPSRKSFLGTLTGDAAPDRDAATHVACAVAVFAGADAIRVHDVAGARGAMRVADALRRARRDPT
jgi:dihydropteroate synthase